VAALALQKGISAMRIVLGLVAVLAALVFMAASASMNWVFLSSLGKSPLEAQIFGAVSVAMDVMKSLLPVFIAGALAANKRVFAAVASGVFLLFFSFALLSAVGFSAGNRGAVTGGREVITARYEAVLVEQSEVMAKLKGLPVSRPQGVIVEALRGLEQDRRWSRSNSCTEASSGDSRAFCEGYFKVKAELAAAMEAGRLEARLSSLKEEVRRLQDAGAGQAGDVQASLLSRLTGIGVSTAQMALVIAVAVLVEIGAALGLYLAWGWWPEAGRQVAPRVEVLKKAELAPTVRADVLDVPFYDRPPRRLRLADGS
jgi:hypothetical protein